MRWVIVEVMLYEIPSLSSQFLQYASNVTTILPLIHTLAIPSSTSNAGNSPLAVSVSLGGVNVPALGLCGGKSFAVSRSSCPRIVGRWSVVHGSKSKLSGHSVKIVSTCKMRMRNGGSDRGASTCSHTALSAKRTQSFTTTVGKPQPANHLGTPPPTTADVVDSQKLFGLSSRYLNAS